LTWPLTANEPPVATLEAALAEEGVRPAITVSSNHYFSS